MVPNRLSAAKTILLTLLLCRLPSAFGQLSCCDEWDQPIMLELMYMATDCSGSTNGQSSADCLDFDGGPANFDQVYVKICATDHPNDDSQVWKRTVVNLGSSLFFTNKDVGADYIPELTHLFIFADESEGRLLQHVKLESSCKRSLALHDQWGSVRLTAIEGFKGGLCSSHNLTLLPLSFVYFDAQTSDYGVEINWGVSGELFEGKMEVQRSGDGRYFDPLSTFLASSVSGLSDYTYLDHEPLELHNYYRLKIFNDDGSTSYSQIELINNEKVSDTRVYPNPVTDNLQLSSTTKDQMVEVTNLVGEIQSRVACSQNSTRVEMSKLTPGMYFVILQNHQSRKIFSVIKN